MSTPRPVWTPTLQLGEGPLWDAAQQRFLFVDLHGCALHAWYPASDERRSWPLPERICWVIPRRDGDGYMAGLHSGFVRLWLEPTLRLERIGSPHPDEPEVRLNDAKADPWGRIWAGSMHNTQPTLPHGRLTRLNTDQSWQVVEGGIHICNGPAIALDGSWMLHTDSLLNTTYRYELGADGALRHKTVWKTFTDAEGTPDGMTVDADGNVWIAFWGGACVRQFTPSGEHLRTIELPALQVTSVAFGGVDLRTLFITSAKIGLDDATLARYPQSGNAFAVSLDVAGVVACGFGG